MNESEIKNIVVTYFGFTPTMNADKIEVTISKGEDTGEQAIKVKWEEHIGNTSGIARVSPLDIMHEMNLENNKENEKKAIEIMKATAKKEGIYFVEVVGKNKYLLINPKYRR